MHSLTLFLYWNYIENISDNGIKTHQRFTLFACLRLHIWTHNDMCAYPHALTQIFYIEKHWKKNTNTKLYRIPKITSTINISNLLCRSTWCNRCWTQINLIYNVFCLCVCVCMQSSLYTISSWIAIDK